MLWYHLDCKNIIIYKDRTQPNGCVKIPMVYISHADSQVIKNIVFLQKHSYNHNM
ncbi:hypothetical protein GDO81_015932 [Engystomops pustulosus]|uniref:Uncharacterized protein n=1 Tax=Engystomops pustulosus TaxID=76066 RepID=A0AAV7AP62_ENGPU|nr:hypothetical protein GDO81_015932 [Engystomops pustulosus]KAG8563098.1 hypothetical protein GDO81_015932 [Engystomops pustulosus]